MSLSKPPIAGYRFATLLLGLLACFPVVAWSQNDSAPVDFEKSIKPIFEKHCIECHGPTEVEEFRIDVPDELMDYIEPGSKEESDLFLSITSDDEDELMPPPEEDNPLTQEQIALVGKWIDQGAKWPEGVKLVEPEEPDDSEKSSPPETSSDSTDSPDSPDANQSKGDSNLIGATSEEGEKKAPATNKEPKKPQVDPKVQRYYDALGSLHVAAIHIPIGLLLAAGLFALLSLRGNFVMSDCAYYCLWLAVIGGIISCVTGWWSTGLKDSEVVHEVGDLFIQNRVYMHRISALVLTAASLLVALYAAGARRRNPDDGFLWKLGIMLLAAGAGFVGHEGGELVHKKHHYDAINEIGAEWFPGLFGKEEAKEEPKENPKENGEKAPKANPESNDLAPQGANARQGISANGAA